MLAQDWKYKVAVDMQQLPPRPPSLNDPNHPTLLYNAMLAPLAGFPIRGVIWYQGESNSARAKQYEQLFPLMIGDWRKHWGSDFAFYFVQLANFDASPNEDWPALREAQRKTLSLPNTGMAVAIDIGNDNDIHPKDKQEVARRLALWAKAKTYKLSLPSYSGPLYSHCQPESGKIRIAFTHADAGLKTNDGKPLGGFSVAGDDHIFYDAAAQVVGSEVVASSPKVPRPTAVRYAWTAVRGSANLCNGAGLPASPFTSE
jgi:sialate O-acetylesterase